MNGMVSCEYNMDSGCIELKFVDGTEIAIDCTAVENLTANNMYERFELDYLIYNAPLAYADLILNGNPETYLKAVIVCNHLRTKKNRARSELLPASPFPLHRFAVLVSCVLRLYFNNTRDPSMCQKTISR